MVFNATFNNILVISWRSVLLVEETEVSWENHRPATSHLQINSCCIVDGFIKRHDFKMWNFFNYCQPIELLKVSYEKECKLCKSVDHTFY
jgi:hypothetical protein